MARPCRKEVNRVLLQALACGGGVEHAAQRAGIGERTAYRRLADPKFQAQLSQYKAELVQRMADMLTAGGMGAVKTLINIQQDMAVSAAVRRRAARDVLEMGIKYRESADWEARLRALEKRVLEGEVESDEIATTLGRTREDSGAARILSAMP
jgi:hypothetical protein